jgi:hypothetical protein
MHITGTHTCNHFASASFCLLSACKCKCISWCVCVGLNVNLDNVLVIYQTKSCMYAQQNWETQLNHHGQLKRKRRLPTRRWELKSFVTNFFLKALIAQILMNKATGPSFLPCFGRNIKTLWLCSPVWYEGSLIQVSAQPVSLSLTVTRSPARLPPPDSPSLFPICAVWSIFF